MKTILILDDEEVVRSLVRTILEKKNYRVLEASEGAEALRLVREERPDLILVDWHMPGMSGIEFVDNLREQPDSSAPFIMLTGTDPSEIEERGKALGASSFLLKPFSVEELLQKVKGALKEA